MVVPFVDLKVATFRPKVHAVTEEMPFVVLLVLHFRFVAVSLKPS
jgi:hypothetical protein